MRLRHAGIMAGLFLLIMTTSPASAKTEEEYQEEIRALQKRNTQLENTLEDGSKELKETRDAIKQLKAQLQSLLEQQNSSGDGSGDGQKVKELETQLATAFAQVKDLQQQLKTAEQNAAKLQQVAANNTSAKEAEAQVKKLQQNLELLQNQIKTQQKDASAQQQRTQDELQKLKAEYELQKTQYKTNVATLQAKEQELQALRQTIEKNTAADPRVVELESMLAEMNAKVVKLTQENSALATQLKEQIASQTSTTNAVAKEQLKSEELTKEIARLQGLLDVAQQQQKTAQKDQGKMRELEQQLTDLTAKMTDITSQLEQERENARNAEKKAKELETTLEAAQGQMRKQRASNENDDARVKEFEAMLAELNSRLLKTSQQKADLETRLTEQKTADAQKTEQIYVLEQKISEMQGVLDASKEQVSKEQKSAQQVSTQVNDLQRQLAEANAKALAVSNENIQLQAQLQESRGAEQLKIQELTKEIARLQGLLDSSQQKAAQQEMTTQQIDARIVELESQLAQANARAQEMAAENARLDTELRDQQALQQDDVVKNQSEVTRLKGELRKAAEYVNIKNTELLAAKEENKLLTDKIARYEQDQSSLQAKLATHSNDLQEQSLTVQQLQTRFAETQAQLEQREQAIASLTAERDTLTNAIETVKQQNAALQVELANQEQHLARQSSVPEEAKKRIQELTLELQEAKVKLDTLGSLETAYPAAQKELADLKLEVAALRDAHGEVTVLRPEVNELKQQLERTRREAEFATAQHEKLQQEFAQKAETYQMQQQQYDEISARNRELEEQYQQGLAELQVKEKLLQQALIEKSVLEKVVDEEDLTSVSVLKVKLQETEAENAALQAQIQNLQTAQAVKIPAKETKDAKPSQSSNLTEEAALRLATLEEQVIEERAKRQQLETELQTARQQLISVKTVQQGMTSKASAGTAFSPAEMIKSSTGGTLSVLSWSNDRKKIAYIETTQKAEQLWIMDTQTRQPGKITEWQKSGAAPRLNHFVWAHDNQHFLFSTGQPGQFTLYIGKGSQLIGTPIQIFDQTISYAWSPNQLQFAYFSGPQLIIQTLQGNALPIQIGHAQGNLPNTLAWSPDGSKIVFSARKDSSMDVFILLFSGKSPLLQPLAASPSDDIQPSWSPDGANIAFYVRSAQMDTKIAVIPADKSRAPYIVAHNVSLPADHGPQWMTATSLQYIGEEALSVSQNSLYRVDVKTGQRSSVPLAMMVGE